MENWYTICQVAQILNIKTNKIRFYEKKGLINIKRDISNYRVFTEDDILSIQSILLYREIGLSIEEIKSILKDRESSTEHFNKQWILVNDEISRLSEIRKSLEEIIDNSDRKDEKLFDIIKELNRRNTIKNSFIDRWNFGSVAKRYDDMVKEDKGVLKIYKNYDLILKIVYEKATMVKIDNPKILDIGVGTGNLSEKFLKSGYDIIGIDKSQEMLIEAKRKYKNLRLRIGEFLKIPYGDKTFDVIVSTYAFHHLNDEEKEISVGEMIRVLKEDGIIVMGDLMFEDNMCRAKILKTLSKEELYEVCDEYYS